ncbi:MAG: hypothetical protein QXS51_02095 [Thermoproteota archaeon]|nr:hypothetical protein [Candidatus Brockarchaeota archaeon]
MHFLEDVLITVLGIFLLTSIIIVSQYLKMKFELISSISEDLKVEVNMLSIFNQENNIEALLNKLVEFLNSNGVKWVNIELYSENNGKTTLYNNVLTIPRERVRYIRAIKITSEDVVYLTIGVKDD